MIKNVDRIVEKINELEKIANESEICFKKFISGLRIYPGYPHNEWLDYSDELIKNQRDSKRLYQRYYSASKELVKEYIPSRLTEFECYNKALRLNDGRYNGVFDYIELKASHNDDKNTFLREYIAVFDNQRNILLSIPDVIILADLKLRESISFEFIQNELDESELLFKNEFYRASGAIAGVALERHLKFLCDKHEIEYSYKENISKINDKLKDMEIFDNPQWRYIQHLGDIRNKCDHPGFGEVTEKDARDLIDGTKKVIRDCN